MDPLVEQMNSISLSDRLADAHRESIRLRRHSETGDSTTTAIPLSSEPIVVRSKDGSRWLPAPEERTCRYGGPANDSAVINDTEHVSNAESVVLPHACYATECAVAKVSATIELLELIITYLPTKDIMEQRRTCQRWRETIATSPELRLHFFYYPRFCQPPSTFELLPLSFPGLSIELGEELHLGRWIIVRLTLGAARAISPYRPGKRVRSRSIFEGLRGGLGSRASGPSDSSWPRPEPTVAAGTSRLQYKDLFITQPPIVGVQAFTPPVDHQGPGDGDLPESWEDDEEDEIPPVPTAKMSCDAGITLGFLAETTQSLLVSTAGAEDDTVVIFKAVVSFCRSESAIRKRSTARQVTRIA
ncbi:hypothetical protein LTR78_006185 [Recurvomyces mirabilis]|uniref:F-box domain-containing protein n=1 Tax=Recurvomyces mirabilis TaxID=574656 RepID=A0AAE0WLL3_9PEZI|nr:hypothetical protein LTR78_006185 [Recurvomyces mirabilis]KAK5152027.1 hypothetical protein LTS14_008801 [Recurvomyces mirabilis]